MAEKGSGLNRTIDLTRRWFAVVDLETPIRTYLADYRQTGQRDYLDDLIRAARPLIKSAARTFMFNYGVPPDFQEDLEQEASLGLFKATQRYEFGRGAKFTTYAFYAMLGEMLHFRRDRLPSRRVPRRVKTHQEDLATINRWLVAELGREPTVSETASRLGWTVKEVEATIVSTYAPVSLEYQIDDNITLADGLASEESGFEKPEYEDWVRWMFSRLSPLECRIVALHCQQGLPQMLIGNLVGLSQKDVSAMMKGIRNTVTSLYREQGIALNFAKN